MTAAATRTPRRIVLRPVGPRRPGSPEAGPRRYRLARLEEEARAASDLAPASLLVVDRFAHLRQPHD